MWLDNLIELKKKSGLSSKQIAERTLLPERTVARIFHRETDSPTITTLIPIIKVLGGSFDEIFADTKAVISNQTLIDITTERDLLKDKVLELTVENEKLKMNILHKDVIISHKDEIIALHNYYNKVKER